jgi:putative transposase
MVKSKYHRRLFFMARRKNTMSEGKKNIIASLIQEYDIKTAEDIQEALKDLLGGTIQSMLEAEMDQHLGYEPYERSDNPNSRNGKKPKSLRSTYGEIQIDVPQDRESSFEPQIVKKRQKDISSIENKIIAMYARGLTTRQISDQIEEIYGFEVSEGMVSDITNKLLPEIEEWQQRPLSSVYPIVFIDAVHFSVRDNNIIKKLAAYIILGINEEGQKEVLGIYIGQNESSKYWLSILNELKNRGVKDILILCADGLSGIKESITVAFPNTEYQRCIVHQVRNTLKYVADKDKKEFANDLKTIYHAPTEESGYERMMRITDKWQDRYPNAMKSWATNWDVISPIFKFSAEVRKVIYTTNAIESLNSTYRRLNRQRSVFPSDTALLKALYLATFEATKKWTMTLRNWGKVYGELSIMYEDRLPQ